jgi:hypothetical protein
MKRNQIARETGVSVGSVTNICKAAGRSFDRSTTRKATEARQVDLAALRTDLTGATLRVADKLRKRIEDALDANELDMSPKEAATVFGIFADKHALLSKLEPDRDENSAVGEWLASLGVGNAESAPGG